MWRPLDSRHRCLRGSLTRCGLQGRTECYECRPKPAPKQYGAHSPISNILHRAPFFQNGAKSGFEMCFDIGSRHHGCWGQNTSQIQNKEVYATLYLQVPHVHPAEHTLPAYPLHRLGQARIQVGTRALPATKSPWHTMLPLFSSSALCPTVLFPFFFAALRCFSCRIACSRPVHTCYINPPCPRLGAWPTYEFPVQRRLIVGGCLWAWACGRVVVGCWSAQSALWNTR